MEAESFRVPFFNASARFGPDKYFAIIIHGFVIKWYRRCGNYKLNELERDNV